ncbi:MAG: GspE/PulE family protein [Gemmatimonadota bacterium]
MVAKQRLGEKLVEGALITQAQLDEALKLQARTGKNIGETLVGLGYLSEDRLIQVLCEQAGVPFFSSLLLQQEPAAAKLIPAEVARAHTAVPIKQQAGRLWVAMANPFDIGAVTDIERSTGRAIKVAGAPRNAIETLLDPATLDGMAVVPAETPADAHDAPALIVSSGDEHGTIAQVADELLRKGISAQATDIHIEPLEQTTRLRYRIDGVLQDGASYPRALHASLVTRLKIMAGLNISETRVPQDGRFRFQIHGSEVDVRVSSFPTLYGEDVVLRLLDKSRVALDLHTLGIAASDLKLFRQLLTRPHGLIAVTGPTGSGKTTTLYSALAELNTGTSCIITLEDPIEYELSGIRQSQINPRAGLTFASGLRSVLRHDPDVILIGEMRDRETVQIGLSAALTGHLVLTTLHTNTAAGAIPRLIDMGAEPFLLTSSLLLVVSQRLVRKLCDKCKQPAVIPRIDQERFGLAGHTVYAAVGCRACAQTGYRGRVGLFEFLPITGAVVTRIYDRGSADEIQASTDQPTLFADGLDKVRNGVTSLDEVLRVTAA